MNFEIRELWNRFLATCCQRCGILLIKTNLWIYQHALQAELNVYLQVELFHYRIFRNLLSIIIIIIMLQYYVRARAHTYINKKSKNDDIRIRNTINIVYDKCVELSHDIWKKFSNGINWKKKKKKKKNSSVFHFNKFCFFFFLFLQNRYSHVLPSPPL